MAENKKSFLLYCDTIFTVKKLTDEQAGKLFKHILSYVNDEHPCMDDVLLDLVFEPIKQSLKRDLLRYESICNRNKKNGVNGGRPTKEPKKPSGLIGNPKNPDEPKKPDSDIDSVNDSDTDIKEKEISKETLVFLKAVEWMKENCPIVLKMKEPLSESQFTQLRKEYSNEQIKSMLLKMHNWKPLLKKNQSANLTFRNWSKKEKIETIPESNKNIKPNYWDQLKPEYR